jgi:phosphoglycerol transferase MdoB-like AlkP superfamily enzyme
MPNWKEENAATLSLVINISANSVVLKFDMFNVMRFNVVLGITISIVCWCRNLTAYFLETVGFMRQSRNCNIRFEPSVQWMFDTGISLVRTRAAFPAKIAWLSSIVFLIVCQCIQFYFFRCGCGTLPYILDPRPNNILWAPC